MSLKRNIAASYGTQIYVTVIGLVILPMYLKYMGAEAYGLVGFFAMLQMWFGLLDIGLSPTIARETARFRAGALPLVVYQSFLTLLTAVFLVLAIFGATSIVAAASYISRNWLNVSNLNVAEVKISVQLMGCAVALRWMSGFYRSCISGAELMVWLSKFNAIVATLRFVLILPIIIYLDNSCVVFFAYQFCVALIELFFLKLKAKEIASTRLYHFLKNRKWLEMSSAIKPMLKFSMSLAITSTIWVIVTQTDKLLLSKLIPLAEYGYFTLAALMASSVMMVSGPVSSSISPRLANLQASSDFDGVIAVYKKATQLVSAVALSAAFTLIIFAEEILWIWTGDREVVSYSSNILRLYAAGNGVLAISAFPYYLQFAKGDLKLHLIGNILFVSILIPSLYIATQKMGAIGSGYTWLFSNILYFLTWVPFVHKRFSPTLHKEWLMRDVLPIFLMLSILSTIIFNLKFDLGSNLLSLLAIAFCALTLVIGSGLCSSEIRAYLIRHLNK